MTVVEIQNTYTYNVYSFSCKKKIISVTDAAFCIKA